MKKALMIALIDLVYTVVSVEWITPNLQVFLINIGLPQTVASHSWNWLSYLPSFLIFLALNHWLFRQKILFKPVPRSRIFGVLWLSGLYLLLGITAAIFGHVSAVNILWLFWALVPVGVIEEYIYRGLLFGDLLSEGLSMGKSLLISTALFALGHITQLFFQTPLGTFENILIAAPYGLVAALLYAKTRNLIYPIIFHVMLDFNLGIVMAGTVHSMAMQFISFMPTVLFVVVLLTSIIYLVKDKKELTAFATELSDSSEK